MSEAFTITNTTKGKLPRLPFLAMKNAILGKEYDLSVVIVGRKTSHALNNTYRSKNKPTDILSFPLSPKEGEILVNPEETKKKALEHGRTYANYLGLLFIHGLVHLKGFDHGARMDREEKKWRSKFRI